MKRLLLILSLALLSLVAGAQELDSLTKASVDTTLVGRDILSLMGDGIQITQSVSVRTALNRYIGNNEEKKLQGYRIRVFYDNSPQARTRSESVEASLQNQFPQHGVYRSFESPNYKVTVGDFRSKDEALKVFMILKNVYPTAYIIKETINYPL